MPQNSWADESAVTNVMSFGTSGSVDFGGATPSSSTCKCTMDGNDINNGAILASGRATPSGNNRATGSVSSLGAGSGTSISTGKSAFAIVSNELYMNVAVSAMSVGSFTLFNYDFVSHSFNYSYI